ncbi:MAG: CRISPR-associated endonuclease Cas2 [Maritimibacter sp.]|nr:CRISPR-associated endonuclease Cas2 [Maritimibacter sp.]
MAQRIYIVAYDISDRKRWRRVFGVLHRKAEHRQLSVFLIKTDAKGAARLAATLQKLIDPKTDSVLIAPLGRGDDDRMIELGVSGPYPGARVAII